MKAEQERRPVHGGTANFQADPSWGDHLLFYEYFHQLAFSNRKHRKGSKDGDRELESCYNA